MKARTVAWPLLAATLVCLTGCETPAALAPLLKDESPERPTVVQESVITSAGLHGVAPLDGTVTVLTRPDMRREQTQVQGTGSVTRLLIGQQNSARITRLDLGRIWEIDLSEGEYRECPLTGCPSREARDLERGPAPGGTARASCRMRVVARNARVVDTGKRDSIQGWIASQTRAELTVTLEDNAARRSTSVLTAEFWTTPATPPMQEARAVEQRFEQDFARAARSTVLLRVPADLRDLVDSLLAGAMAAEDRVALLDVERDLPGVTGQPVRTVLTWNVTGDACGGTGLGLLARRTDAPLFSVSYELRRYALAPVRDSRFYLPQQLRRKQ